MVVCVIVIPPKWRSYQREQTPSFAMRRVVVEEAHPRESSSRCRLPDRARSQYEAEQKAHGAQSPQRPPVDAHHGIHNIPRARSRPSLQGRTQTGRPRALEGRRLRRKEGGRASHRLLSRSKASRLVERAWRQVPNDRPRVKRAEGSRLQGGSHIPHASCGRCKAPAFAISLIMPLEAGRRLLARTLGRPQGLVVAYGRVGRMRLV